MALDLDIQRHTRQMWARRVSFLQYEDKARLLPGEKPCLRQMGPTRSFLGDGGALAGGRMFGQRKGVCVQRLGSKPLPILPLCPLPALHNTDSCSPWEEKCCDPRIISEAGTLPAFAQARGGERSKCSLPPAQYHQRLGPRTCTSHAPRSSDHEDETTVCTTRHLKIPRCCL